MKVFRSLALLIGITLLTALPLAAQAPAYSAFYVFGDSLADNGNDYIATALDLPPVPVGTPTVPPGQTYYCGRFSNGPVAFERLWTRLQPAGAPLFPVLGVAPGDLVPDALNFAFGGSGTGKWTETPGGFKVPGLLQQVSMFSTLVPDPSTNALYAVLSGANDYLVQPPATPASPVVTVRNIALAIEQLYRHGARTIIVVALPDLGRVPLVPQQQKLQMSVLSAVHNILLAGAVQTIRHQHRDLSLVLADPNRVIAGLPSSVNRQVPMLDVISYQGASMCLILNPLACPTLFDPAQCPAVPTIEGAERYLFWDAQHPTTAVHARLADYIYDQLAR